MLGLWPRGNVHMEFMKTIRENRELATQLVANLLAMHAEESEMIVTVNDKEYTVRISLE